MRASPWGGPPAVGVEVDRLLGHAAAGVAGGGAGHKRQAALGRIELEGDALAGQGVAPGSDGYEIRNGEGAGLHLTTGDGHDPRGYGAREDREDDHDHDHLDDRETPHSQ